MTTCDRILARWPLRAMAARLGLELPRDGVKFRSPFRPDHTPSCTIHRETIRDWSTGEHFDAIRMFAEKKALTNREAIRQLAAELPDRARPRASRERGELTIPPLAWDHARAARLAEQRGLGLGGVHLAGAVLGTLGFGQVLDFDCWVLRDASERLAEARRMDGEKFPACGPLGERKSHTLRGSLKSWPLGLSVKPGPIAPERPVVLVEGGPDYLAACDLLFAVATVEREFLPVAMLGAAQRIQEDALPFFRGRRVTILAHPDESGLRAAQRWCGQLREAKVLVIQLGGGDLNDLVAQRGAASVLEDLNL